MSQLSNLFKNSVALALVQALNYLVPLVSIPYLIRVLGAHEYGAVALAISAYMALSLLADFGFQLSGARAVAEAPDDRESIGRLLTAVTVVRVALALLGLTLIWYGVGRLPDYADERVFIVAYCFAAVGQALTPAWLFAGLQRLAVVALAFAAGKFVYLGLLLWLVRSPDDLIVVGIAQASSLLIAAAISWVALRRLGMVALGVTVGQVWQQFVGSTVFFLTRVSLLVYTAGCAMFLATLGTPLQLTFYSTAEQGFRAVQGMANTVQHSLFPMMAGRQPDVEMFWRVLRWMTGAIAIAVLPVVIFGREMLAFAFGPEMVSAYAVVAVFCMILLVDVPATLLGYPLMAAYERLDLANRSMFMALGVQCLSLSILWTAGWLEAWQVAGSVLIVEVLLLIYRGVWARRLQLLGRRRSR